MKIKRVVTGVLEENCYVLLQGNDCLVIDPGDEFTKIKKAMGNKNVLGVLITHSHFDHVGALRNFLSKKTKIYKKSNVEDQKEYTIGPFSFKILFTPGHSRDSISFFFENEKIIFTGDFIFRETVGRVDLPSGNQKEMQESIEKFKQMNENFILYPGHGEATSLLYEKQNNVYFKER